MDQKSQHLEHERGSWGSNFGFLMAAVGSAVGLGNIWGFPYKMGMTGGFAFLIVYLILVVIVGCVVMLGELALGRKTGRGAVGAYMQFSKKHKWVGFLGVVAGFCLLSFYNVLGGMVMRYMFGFFFEIVGIDGFGGQGTNFFGALLYDYGGMLFFHVLFVIINILIVMGGVESGIEKFSSVAMPALFFILLFVVVYIAFQDGAAEGYAFIFKPDFSAMSTFDGFLNVLKTAAGQMFFSLSLGMGCMITYGSYLDKKEDLQKNAIIIPACDTLIALMAAMAVMPACAAYDVPYASGPGLLFTSMQQVFFNMGEFGSFVGFMFYFLVFIAAVTSSISLLEVVCTYRIDSAIDKGKKPNRQKITCIAAGLIFVIGLPVALDALGSGGAAFPAPYEIIGYQAAEGFKIPMAIDCWLDFFDVISEGILMPFGALAMSVLIGWVYKTKKAVVTECEQAGHKFWGYGFFNVCFKFIVPAIMILVLVAQVIDFFVPKAI